MLDIKEEITITLKKGDIQAIIKDYLKTKGYRVEGNVDFKIASQSHGDCRETWTTHELANASCKVVREQ